MQLEPWAQGRIYSALRGTIATQRTISQHLATQRKCIMTALRRKRPQLRLKTAMASAISARNSVGLEGWGAITRRGGHTQCSRTWRPRVVIPTCRGEATTRRVNKRRRSAMGDAQKGRGARRRGGQRCVRITVCGGGGWEWLPVASTARPPLRRRGAHAGGLHMAPCLTMLGGSCPQRPKMEAAISPGPLRYLVLMCPLASLPPVVLAPPYHLLRWVVRGFCFFPPASSPRGSQCSCFSKMCT